MSGFVDSVNKFHVMYHESGAMHCDSHANTFDAAESLLKKDLWRHDDLTQAKLLEEFKARIDSIIQQIKDESNEEFANQ